MGRAFMRFSVGTAGGSADNIHYITREPATNADRESVLVRNYPAEVTEARDYDELRDRLEEYADEQERAELDRPRRGGGETRTHYKVILSFEQEIDTEQARDMADEYLDREFSRCSGRGRRPPGHGPHPRPHPYPGAGCGRPEVALGPRDLSRAGSRLGGHLRPRVRS